MTTHRDPDRQIRAFLTERPPELSDRTYFAIRSSIERTQQRAFVGPWRLPLMQTYLKLGIAAAAVVVVAVVGINLLPSGNGQVGGPAATSTTAPTPSPDRSPGPRPPDWFPPDGALPPGTYDATLEGVPVSFTVTASDWSSNFGSVGNDHFLEPSGISVAFWENAPDNTYADPCAHTPLSPKAAHTAAGLIAAVAGMPGVDIVAAPSSVPLGGRTAETVTFRIRDDIDCPPTEFYLWYDDATGGPDGGYVYAAALGSIHQVWVVDVGDKVVWIDAVTFAGQGPEVAQTLQAFMDSIKFN
jgi:hypothetical protein